MTTETDRGTDLDTLAVDTVRTLAMDAIQKAVKDLITDGTYKQLTDKWGISDGGITDPKVNGAAG